MISPKIFYDGNHFISNQTEHKFQKKINFVYPYFNFTIPLKFNKKS